MSEGEIKVFISYSRDSLEHRKKVKELVNQLRGNSLNVIYDNDMELGDRISYFMEHGITQSAYVLFICTPNYKLHADARKDGAGYENTIITSELYTTQNERKFIPVLFSGSIIQSYPSWCRDKLGVNLSFPIGSPDYNEELAKLISSLKKESQSNDFQSIESNFDINSKEIKTNKRKKVIGLLVSIIGLFSALITIFVYFSGYGTLNELKNSAQDTIEPIQNETIYPNNQDFTYVHGNSNSNLNSDIQGFAAQQEDILYLSYDDYIYKLIEDGSDAVKFASSSPYACINILNNWVYTCSLGDLYRTTTDNSKHELIYAGNASEFRYTVYNDYIYFIKLGMDFGIARIKLDGSDYEKIVSAQTFFIFFDENWLYFDDGFDSNIYRVNINNTDEIETFVDDKKGMEFIVEDNWLYYESERYGKCRMNIKLKTVQGLHKNVILTKCFVKGNYLYSQYRGYLWRTLLNSNSEPEEFIKLPFGSNLERYSYNSTDNWIFILATDAESGLDELHLFQYPINGGELVQIDKLLKTIVNFVD